jgi:hypothetical protein
VTLNGGVIGTHSINDFAGRRSRTDLRLWRSISSLVLEVQAYLSKGKISALKSCVNALRQMLRGSMSGSAKSMTEFSEGSRVETWNKEGRSWKGMYR